MACSSCHGSPTTGALLRRGYVLSPLYATELRLLPSKGMSGMSEFGSKAKPYSIVLADLSSIVTEEVDGLTYDFILIASILYLGTIS